MAPKPSGLASTLTGLWALMTLASGNAILDKIVAKIDSGSGGILKSVSDWLIGVIRSAYNNVVGFLVPSAPAAFGWLQADSYWLDNIAYSTYNTLQSHRSRLLWLQNTYIAGIHKILTSDINNAHSDAIAWTVKVANGLNTSMVALFNNEVARLNAVHTQLTKDINNAHDNSIDWTNRSINTVTATISQLFNYTNQHIASAITTAKAYTDKAISGVNTKLTLLGITLGASIVALGNFITEVEIPGAIEASVAALNAEAAASMDINWEILATTANKSLAELTLADLDPLWLKDVLSEIPALSLAGADSDMSAALKLLMNYLSRAGVPLYKNLRKFGEDTSELDGVLTTVILGGLTTEALLNPKGSADVVAELLGNPLNEVLTAVGGLVGLT
jgi:hypothetical protein